MKILLIILATIVAFVLLVGGGCFAFAMWYFGEVEEIVQQELESRPEFVERVGKISELDIDFAAGSAFSFLGEKANGVVFIPGISPAANRDLALVRLDDGEQFELEFDDQLVTRRFTEKFESSDREPSPDEASPTPPDETPSLEPTTPDSTSGVDPSHATQPNGG